MLKQNNLRILIGTLIQLSFLTSCSLIDLTGLKVTSTPGESGSILPADSAIVLHFSEEVRHSDVENALSIEHENTGIEFDLFWDSTDVRVVPLSEYYPAERYELKLIGNIETARGAVKAVHYSLSYYYAETGSRVFLQDVTPADGAVISAFDPITFSFTGDIDQQSFENHLNLETSIEYTIVWSGTSAIISPDTHWENLTSLNWAIPQSVTDIFGRRILSEYAGNFFVQADAIPPALDSITPVSDLASLPTVIASAPSLEELGYTDSLAFRFSEGVDFTTARDAIEFSPAVAGSYAAYGSDLIVFTAETGWDTYTDYQITLTTDLQDLSGNHIPEAQTTAFSPISIPEISVATVTGSGPVTFPLGTTAPETIVPVDVPPDPLRFTFTIQFSESYNLMYRASVEDSITAKAIAPKTCTSLTLVSRNWSAPDTLDVTFEGWALPDASQPYYYLFKITGGENTRNQEGGYMEEDVEIYVTY